MRGHTPFFELQEALGEAGCSICRLTVAALEQFFGGLVYEKVNDRSLRETMRRAYGLCGVHGEMLRAARSALGVAIIQRDVLRAAARAIGAESGARLGRGWRKALLGKGSGGPLVPEGVCVGCAEAEATSTHWAGVLGQHYTELRPAFQGSNGLCVAHLRAALGKATPAVAAMLRDDQVAIWARLEEELDEFIRKHDHQFTGEEVGAERDAWARATLLVSGDARALGGRR